MMMMMMITVRRVGGFRVSPSSAVMLEWRNADSRDRWILKGAQLKGEPKLHNFIRNSTRAKQAQPSWCRSHNNQQSITLIEQSAHDGMPSQQTHSNYEKRLNVITCSRSLSHMGSFHCRSAMMRATASALAAPRSLL